MSKPIIEQRDRYEQRLTLHLEMANGEAAQPMVYLRRLLATQSLEGWNGRQDELRDWLADQMANYFRNLNVHIWGHSKDVGGVK